jgi:hypothetical protein
VDFPEGNGRGGKCDPFCTGATEESEAPEVNLANATARPILGLLGLLSETDGDDLCGNCDAATLRQRIFRARNRDRSAALREGYELEPGHAGVAVVQGEDGLTHIERRGPRMIVCEFTDDQVLDRLDLLDRLAQWAQENGHPIHWG